MKPNRIIKIIASICFVLIAVALLIIRDSPATGYEVSIYEATPTLVWLSLFFSIACGIGIIVHQVYSQEEHSKLWILGLALILTSNTIILSLHILRGYALWTGSGDPATHLGWIQAVIRDYQVLSGNFYPITHIYLAQLSTILGVNPIVLFKWVPVLFALLAVVFTYLLARYLLPEKRQVLLATVAGTVLIHGWYLSLTPNHLSNLLFPFFIYVLLVSVYVRMWQWKLLFIIIVLLVAPLHPNPTFALLIVLLALWLGRLVPTNPFQKSHKDRVIVTGYLGLTITTIMLLVSWGITWISSFGVWDRMIRNIHILVTEGAVTYWNMLMSDVQYAQAYAFSIGEYFLKEYGGFLVFITLTLIAVPILLKKRSSDTRFSKITALFWPLAMFTVAFLLVYLQNTAFSPRLLVYIIILCPIFVGFTLAEFQDWVASRRSSLKKVVSIVIAALLLAVSVGGVLKVYPSPYIFASNRQTTQAEIQGGDWFFQNKGDTAEVSYWRTNLGRFSYFLLIPYKGGEFSLQRYVPNEEWKERPQHFGYGEHSMIGQSYGKDAYMVLGEQDRVLYTGVFPELAEVGVLPEDFIKLASDPSADKLYSNGGLDVWYIYQAD